MPVRFLIFLNMATSGTQIFHKVATCARCGGIFAYLPENLPMKNFFNGLSFDGVTALSLVSFLFWTWDIITDESLREHIITSEMGIG